MSKEHPSIGDHVRLEVGDLAVEGELVLVHSAAGGAFSEAVQTIAGPPVLIRPLRGEAGFKLRRLAKAGDPIPKRAQTPGNLFLAETLDRVFTLSWALVEPVQGVRSFGAEHFSDDETGYLAFQLHLQGAEA